MSKKKKIELVDENKEIIKELYKLHDANGEADKKAKVVKRISKEDSDKARREINAHMEEVTREFRQKMGKSIVSASKVYVGRSL